MSDSEWLFSLADKEDGKLSSIFAQGFCIKTYSVEQLIPVLMWLGVGNRKFKKIEPWVWDVKID